MARWGSPCSLVLSLLALTASPSGAEAPTIIQLPGAAGCLNATGAEDCADSHSLNLP